MVDHGAPFQEATGVARRATRIGIHTEKAQETKYTVEVEVAQPGQLTVSEMACHLFDGLTCFARTHFVLHPQGLRLYVIVCIGELKEQLQMLMVPRCQSWEALAQHLHISHLWRHS